MEILWYGHACFKITGGGVVLVTDPTVGSEQVIGSSSKVDIVTISHKAPDHSSYQNLSGNPKIIDGPGEYEISNVNIRGLGTAFNSAEDPHQINTMYVIEIEGIVVCHLGSLNDIPSSREMGVLGDASILLVPAGNGTAIDQKKAVELVHRISPKIVVPMHYRTSTDEPHLEPVEPFLKELGVKEPERRQKLNITRTSLPSETRVVILEKVT